MSMNSDTSMVQSILCDSSADVELASAVARRLSIPLIDPADSDHLPQSGSILLFNQSGLWLQQLGKKSSGPVGVDFANGSVAHRRKFGGGKGQMIAKAVGLNKGSYLKVFDATAGLGKDAFVLASLGCDLILAERNPVVSELLADGLRRGREGDDSELADILRRMTLVNQSSHIYMAAVATQQEMVDVVYLDPMFPSRTKSASVKKEMVAFHSLVGSDSDSDLLLDLALAVARYRVVVKRPSKAPFLNDTAPTYQLTGKTSRYDIYVNAKIEQ